jgi:hypothetical protein
VLWLLFYKNESVTVPSLNLSSMSVHEQMSLKQLLAWTWAVRLSMNLCSTSVHELEQYVCPWTCAVCLSMNLSSTSVPSPGVRPYMSLMFIIYIHQRWKFTSDQWISSFFFFFFNKIVSNSVQTTRNCHFEKYFDFICSVLSVLSLNQTKHSVKKKKISDILYSSVNQTKHSVKKTFCIILDIFQKVLYMYI